MIEIRGLNVVATVRTLLARLAGFYPSIGKVDSSSGRWDVRSDPHA